MLMTATSSRDYLTEHGRKALDNRMHDLRLKYKDVAERSGMSTAHLRRILNGEQIISDDKAAGLEDALRLQRGSIAALLANGQITPLSADDEADKTLRQLLLERGLAEPEDLAACDEVRGDPVVLEILALRDLNVPEDDQNRLLTAYANMRRAAYLAIQAKKNRPRS